MIKDKKASTLASSQYLLFELPMNYPVSYLEETIFEIQSNGMIPIMAHPERYTFVQKDPNVVYHWIKKGVLIQANFASSLGYYGKASKDTLKKLLKANMIHFFGSDAHEKEKYSLIKKNIEQIKRWISDQQFITITQTNPKHILNNIELQIKMPEKIKRGLFY